MKLIFQLELFPRRLSFSKAILTLFAVCGLAAAPVSAQLASPAVHGSATAASGLSPGGAQTSSVAAKPGAPALETKTIVVPAASLPSVSSEPLNTIIVPMPPMVGLAPPPAIKDAALLDAAKDYKGAAKKLLEVQTSTTYKDTPYAAYATYLLAHIYRDRIKDPTLAMPQYSKLVSDYSKFAGMYPHSTEVNAEREATAGEADRLNSAKPLYKFVDFFVRLTGSKSYSYSLALLIISIVIRLAITPLTLRQYQSMREMQRLQPLLKEIQAKYDKDPQVRGQKMMELYKEHNVNPAAGCFPMLIQLPIFYYMYQAIVQYQYHFEHGTFLWIGSHLSFVHHQYLGTNLMEPDYILLFLYSVSMYVTQRMMPATDPSQAEMQKTTALMMSFMFFFMFSSYHFPSAFVLYWLISNILSAGTQQYFMRTGLYPPPGVKASLPSDGEKPDSSKSNGLSKDAVKQGDATETPRYAKAGGASKGVMAPKTYSKKKRR